MAEVPFLTQVQDLGRGLNRGATSDLVGAPVDIINMLLKAMDATKILPQRFATEKPVGGSEWIQEMLAKGGMAYKMSDSPTEHMGRLLGMLAVNPTAIGRTGALAEKGVMEAGKQLDPLVAAYAQKVGLSPQILAGRRGAERLGGRTLEKFLAGEKAAEEGMAPQALWREHGYAKGAEGKGRFEISDVPAEIRRVGDTTVGEGIAHPELFKAYPELAKLPLEMRLGAAQTTGGFNTATGRIRVNAADMPEAKSASMHELQHGVAREEGFAPGTSLKLGQEQYVRSAGEVEARNVQARLKNPDLMQFTPEMTESIPRAAQLGKDAKWEDFIARNPQAAKMLLMLKGLRR